MARDATVVVPRHGHEKSKEGRGRRQAFSGGDTDVHANLAVVRNPKLPLDLGQVYTDLLDAGIDRTKK